MDGIEAESSNRKRWHFISGITVCMAMYVVTLTLLKLYVLP